MRKRFFLCLALIALLGCVVSGGWVAPLRAQSPEVGGSVGKLVIVQGQVLFRRKNWSKFVPAIVDTWLQPGDILRLVDRSSKAEVVCTNDGTRHNIPGGDQNVPCKANPSGRPIFTHRGSRIRPTRGDTSDPLFPTVISPRRTKLLNARPTLRWTPVAGATTYQVIVRGLDSNWRAEVSSKTEIVYPDDAPALAAGETYTLAVIADGRSSDQESQPGLGFKLFNADEAQAVRTAEAKIRALGLADTPTRFLIADLYASSDLNAEAIEGLESLSKTSRTPAVMRSLGELYIKVGLNRLAEERYLQALELSQKANDVEGQALAESMLGLIYQKGIGNTDEAIQRWQKSLKLYQALGDSEEVKQIREQLARLRKL